MYQDLIPPVVLIIRLESQFEFRSMFKDLGLQIARHFRQFHKSSFAWHQENSALSDRSRFLNSFEESEQWYFVSEIVLTTCEKNVLVIEKKLLKFQAEGREFAKSLRSIEQFIRTVTMKFAFMQNPLTQIPFFAWIYNSFIISHLLEWLKVRQIKSGIRVNFDQCAWLFWLSYQKKLGLQF